MSTVSMSTVSTEPNQKWLNHAGLLTCSPKRTPLRTRAHAPARVRTRPRMAVLHFSQVQRAVAHGLFSHARNYTPWDWCL